MTDYHTTRRVRAGGHAPTELPPLPVNGSHWRRHVRAVIPYAFFVVLMLLGGAFGLVIALGSRL
jgi:hypothetical protein